MWILETLFWVALLLVGYGIHTALELPDWTMPGSVIPAFVFAGWRLKSSPVRAVLGIVVFALAGLVLFVIDRAIPRIERAYWLLAAGLIFVLLSNKVVNVIEKHHEAEEGYRPG